MGNIQFDEVYNGSSVEKICNTLPRSLRWEIGDSIKVLIAADEISRSERRVVSRNAKREKTTSRFCCCRSRMLMNFWDKQATLMKMLVNSASNGRGSIVLSSWWLDTGPFTPCRTSRVEFLAQREAYAYIREFQWFQRFLRARRLSFSIMDIASPGLFRSEHFLRVEHALSTPRICSIGCSSATDPIPDARYRKKTLIRCLSWELSLLVVPVSSLTLPIRSHYGSRLDALASNRFFRNRFGHASLPRV